MRDRPTQDTDTLNKQAATVQIQTDITVQHEELRVQ
jgi:hypothetical protein